MLYLHRIRITRVLLYPSPMKPISFKNFKLKFGWNFEIEMLPSLIIDILISRRNISFGKNNEPLGPWCPQRWFCVQSTRDWHFGFETSRFRNFCQIFEGFGFGFGKFGLGKKVLVSENLVLEKSICIGFRKFGPGKKVSVSVKILVQSFSDSSY